MTQRNQVCYRHHAIIKLCVIDFCEKISYFHFYLSFSHVCASCEFLARDTFVRTNRRAIVMMLVRSSVRPSVCLSVCLSGTAVHCGHTMRVIANLSLLLNSTIVWARLHQSMSTYSQPSFSSSTWKGGGHGCAN